MTSASPLLLVWGNCQAEPIASLLEEPAREAGLTVVHVPPVFLLTEAELQDIQRRIMPRVDVLVGQPVRDEYRFPGCGTRQMAALLADHARLVTFPITYDSSAFPYQVNAHRGDGHRIDAPLTSYHDLRALVAAERGYSVDEALAWWPQPTAEMVLTNAERSGAELRRREESLDVGTSDLLGPTAMFTLSHPTNVTLAAVARRLVDLLGLSASAINVPDREFLGARRTPIEQSVCAAMGWPEDCHRQNWIVDGGTVPLADVLAAQLEQYDECPDVVADSRIRYSDRLELLQL